MNTELTRISKFLSFILRHKPESIGLVLDDAGWAVISELIEKSRKPDLSKELIRLIVETNDKQRFCIDESGTRIRANQGHSIAVNLELAECTPPVVLYHGTASRFVDGIKEQGLTKQQRHHVHLSQSIDVAKAVGARHGTPVIFEIPALKMHSEGYKFYKSANNVWLIDHVPVAYLLDS